MALAMTLTEPESWHSVECHAGVGTGSFYALSKEKEPPTDSQARLGCVCLDPFNSFFYKKIENEKAKTLIYYFQKNKTIKTIFITKPIKVRKRPVMNIEPCIQGQKETKIKPSCLYLSD